MEYLEIRLCTVLVEQSYYLSHCPKIQIHLYRVAAIKKAALVSCLFYCFVISRTSEIVFHLQNLLDLPSEARLKSPASDM